MQVSLTPRHGQKGTAKALKRYGNRLNAVRYARAELAVGAPK